MIELTSNAIIEKIARIVKQPRLSFAIVFSNSLNLIDFPHIFSFGLTLCDHEVVPVNSCWITVNGQCR